jgi:hypothetical protein
VSAAPWQFDFAILATRNDVMALDVGAPIDDIEDSYIDPDQTRSSRTQLPCPGEVEGRLREPEESERRSVPGAQSIWVKTFGCSHNQSDSEYMMGVLEAYGYRYASCWSAVWEDYATKNSHVVWQKDDCINY